MGPERGLAAHLSPLDWKLTVGSFILNANDFIAVIVAPVAMIGVGLFLTRTRIGTAVRAAAERSERASLLGIPVGGLSTVVWMIAAALSFLALFLRAGILGIPLVRLWRSAHSYRRWLHW